MLKVDDKVYYRTRVGMFYRTISGVIIKIKGDTATIKLTTQNGYGGVKDININILSKSKEQ